MKDKDMLIGRKMKKTLAGDLSGKAVLITGASRGIGQETAYKFAKEGCRLALTYNRGKKEAAETSEECLSLGAKDALAIQLDVSDYESIQAAVKQTIAKFGKISILVNNAGTSVWKPLIEQTNEEIEAQIGTNLEGLIKMTRECLPHIQDAIINIASITGKQAYANLTTYSATKFGVRGFTRALGQEYPDLRIYAVNPDGIATRMTGFRGRPPEQVAEVIVDAAKGKYDVPNGGDIDVWDVK